MAEKCLRNASCKCSMCAGFDVASLMSISKSITSNIQYDDTEEASEAPPVSKIGGGVANSPPLSTKKTFVSNSPPLQPVQSPIEAVSMDVEAHDVNMVEVASVQATVDTSGPSSSHDPQLDTSEPLDDMQVDTVASTLSDMEVDSAGPSPCVSLDTVLPQLTDKNWKVRKEAYEALKRVFEQPEATTSQVQAVLELFTKLCEDSNASAMEAGFAAVLAYTLNVEPFEKEIVPAVMARVTDKGFSARPGIVKLCEELTDAFVAAGAADETTVALLEGTANRKPKVPPACLSCLLEALKAYGPRVLPLQRIKNALPKLMEGPVKARPIAMSIMVEIHRWTGPALLQDVVATLRPAQQTDFEGRVKDVVPGQAVPVKFIRGAKAAKATAGTAHGKPSEGSNESVAPAAAAIDPRDFVETVDLLAKLPKTDFKAKLALPKWSEKVEALKIVLELIGPVPKLANGDYYDLVATLKALTNDSNVNIVAKAIEVFGALADGLRKNFIQTARMIFPELLRKLSDKKTVILSATNHTLDVLVQHVMPLELMMEDLKLACDATKNKAPPARVQTIAFLTRAVEKRYVELTDKTVVTFLATMFQKGVDDTDPKVREAGQVAFVALLKASNETSKWLQPMINDMASKNPRAFKAIQRGIGGTGALTPSSRASSAPPSRPSSASSATSRSSIGAATKVAELDGVVDVEMADAAAPAPARARVSSLKKKAGPPAGRFGMKQPPAAAGNVGAKAVAGKSAGVSAGGGGSTDFTPVAISVSIEEAENILADLELASWAAIQDGFKSTKWMERKAAIEKLQEYAKTHASAMTMRVIEAFTMYLANQVKDFKDSNINVLKSSFEAVGTFAAHAAGKFPRGVVCHVVPRACDKIGDKKANKAVRDLLLSFCEATSPSYTTGCMMEYMPKVRLPLAHIEALVVFLECVQDFGVSICNPRALIDYAKGPQGLESSNPKVRGAAISLLGGMYSQLGPALLPILNLDSWKPALAETVKAEFQKAGYDPASALASVKRQVKDQEEEPKTTVDSGALFGRVDISSQLTKELFEKLKNEADKGAWKKRGEAMDTVQAICEGAGCAIEFTRPVQEVVRMLKARLSDSNANLKVKAANVLAVVATSVGPEIAKMSKILGATLIAGVADNKKAMQAAALQALHKWVRHGGKTSAVCVESLLVPLAEGLGNTVGRAELLGWAVEHVKNCEKLDLHGLVVPTVHCMMDKSSEAREKAQQLLVEVMKSVGKETVLSTGCRDVKPAAMRALKPLLAKVCEAAEANGPESSVPAAVPGLSTTSASSRVAPSTTGNGEAGRSGIRRRASISAGSGTPVKSRLARPGSLKPSVSSTSLVEKTEKEATPLLKMSFNKAARLSRGQSNRWIFEATSLSETNMRKSELEAEWKPFLSPEFHATLFAPSLEKGMLAAMDQLTLCIVHQADEVIASLDLVLKWCTLRMVDNNVQALAKLLEVLIKLVELLKTRQYQLDDVEAAIVLPYLLQESGQSKPRFRVRFRDVMKLVVDVYTPEKYVPYLMECFNNSKNMKSRCECIDLVEYIVTGHGYHVVGRKCIKDVAKYVVAHEKELRESALSTLVAVYTIRSDRDQVDKFFRFAGITTQQGMDLVSARLKHLPSTSSNVGTEASGSEEGAQAPLSLSQRSRRSGFGFGFGRASTVVPPPTPTLSGSTKETGEKSTLQMEKKALNTAPGDEDVDMNAPQDDVGEETMSPSQSIEDLLLRPIELLIDSSSKEVVPAGTQAYKEGGNALKGLYAIIHRPSDPSEVAFLHSYVNEIVLALCDCIHGAFYAGNAEKRPEMYILAMSLTTLTVVFNSEGVTSMQRYTVERVVLELCSKMLDPRLEKVAQQAHVPVAELHLTPEDNRYLMVYKALYKALRKVTEKAKPGDVYTSVINLLQRLMHNDVGEYNKNDALKHLLKEDSLDQLVGRMLLKLSTMQAQLLTPFEGIDVAGVLMQMHGFFATLPRAEVMMVDIANDNMQAALRILAESLWKTRSSVLEAAMKDIPSTSVVRQLVHEMESNVGQGQEAAEPTGWQHTGDKKKETTTVRSAAMKPVSTVTESLSRRLFPPKDTGRGIAATVSSSLTVNGGGPVATRGRSFTSFHDFTAHRSATTTTSRPSTTSEQLESLRERLQQSRHFK